MVDYFSRFRQNQSFSTISALDDTRCVAAFQLSRALAFDAMSSDFSSIWPNKTGIEVNF